MTSFSFDDFLTPNLVITIKGNEYQIPPPSRETGLMLTLIVSTGVAAYSATQDECPACGRTGEWALDEDTLERLKAVQNTDLGEMTLGAPVMRQMTDDEVSEADQDRVAQYALYYWTMGKAVADDMATKLWTPEGRALQAREQEEADAAPKA